MLLELNCPLSVTSYAMLKTSGERAIMKPDQRVLQELVRRIVDAVHPLRIILFGSAARGEMGPDSDLDTLVIMPDGSHRGKTAQEIYRYLWGLGFAKDIVVVTESDIREHAVNPSLVIKEALEMGKELYGEAIADRVPAEEGDLSRKR